MSDNDQYDFTSFYNAKSEKKISKPKNLNKSPKPKYTIFDKESFEKGREMLGGIIVEGMKSTGGTDVDWLIEHRGGFVILEIKELHREQISVRLGQMLAYEKLHERLIEKGKCYMYFVGCGYDVDFDDLDTPLWYFEMNQWKNNGIPYNTENEKYTMIGNRPSRYTIHTDYMTETTICEFREILENHWEEFEK